jgi:hypothetical protein
MIRETDDKREIVHGLKPGDLFVRVVVHRIRHHWWEFWRQSTGPET